MIVEGEMRLKGWGRMDKLCNGEVAEWLNAAVSKTVTSAIPASGVRIPPSPRSKASQHAQASGPSLVSPAALPPCQLVSQGLRTQKAEVLTSDSRRLERAEMLTSTRQGAC